MNDFLAGHVTDAQGVKQVREYFEYLDKAVEHKCDWKDKTKDSECARIVLKGLPSDLRRKFAEPQRMLINAVVTT
jgi:hypothetical protein